MKEVDETKVQEICEQMIEEVEVARGIGIYSACEQLARLLFDDIEKQKRWLQGCLSAKTLAYLRNHDVPNWVDNI